MLAILFIVLLATCLAAPFLGTDTSDARSEAAHPEARLVPRQLVDAPSGLARGL